MVKRNLVATNTSGNGQLIVKGQEVCIGLPGRFKLSGDLRQELRRMPGILNVREL